MKKIISLFLVVTLSLGLLVGCNSEDKTSNNKSTSGTTVFTDSTGREVEVPENITKIAASGPLAFICLFAIAPDELVGSPYAFSDLEKKYIGKKYQDMEEIGQLYGGKGDLNKETIIETGAEVVIDIGEAKDSIVEDMDSLQEQTGIPFVHIDMTLETVDSTYEMLGKLLGKENDAKTLSSYCSHTLENIDKILSQVTKKKVIYLTGDSGLNVIANSSFHAEVINRVADNVALVDNPSSKGTGNETDLEQIINWDPDIIIFSSDSIYDTVSTLPQWQSVRAIQNGDYYEVPDGPYNWMGFPPSVQRYLGLMWATYTLYPDEYRDFYDDDLYPQVRDYFKKFYHYLLTEDDYNDLLGTK